MPDWFPMQFVLEFGYSLLPWCGRVIVLGLLAGTVTLFAGLPKR